jgi:phage tail sheath gpL-like
LVYTKGATLNTETRTFSSAADLAMFIDNDPSVYQQGYSSSQINLKALFVGATGNLITITTNTTGVTVTPTTVGTTRNRGRLPRAACYLSWTYRISGTSA